MRCVQHLIAAQCWSGTLQNRAVLPVTWWWCYLSLSYSLRLLQHLIAAQCWSGMQQNRGVLPVTWWWCYFSLLQFVVCTTFDRSTVLKLHTAEQSSFASHMVMMLSLSLTVWGLYNIWSQHSAEVACSRTEEFCQSHGDDVISLSYSLWCVQHLIAAQCWSCTQQNRGVLLVTLWCCYLSLSYSLRFVQYLIAAQCWSGMQQNRRVLLVTWWWCYISLLQFGVYNIWSQHSAEVPCCRTEQFCQSHGDDVISLSLVQFEACTIFDHSTVLKSHAAEQSSFASHMVMMLSLSLSYSLRHVQYLIPAQCWSHTQQNRAVLLVTWWWCYLSLLQFEACTTFDRSTVLKSHAAEQSSFASHMVMMLNLLQSVMRQYERYTNVYYIT